MTVDFLSPLVERSSTSSTPVGELGISAEANWSNEGESLVVPIWHRIFTNAIGVQN
ncbi:hypothetical protein [Antrihabitans spumae]|uniref:Uncharacterized protein n=1 Tax=Antrihabitans spumae TaxID=3373370 RepID=A0ABW7JMF2_9NOCA